MYLDMMDGLWTAEFGSSTGGFSGGVVVLRDGKLMGGDAGYYYLGDYQIREKSFQATIQVFPFLKEYESVFKTVGQNLKLNLVGSLIDGSHATAQGHPEGMPHLRLGVRLTKRS